MYEGQLVFSQLTDHLPFHVFRKCVRRYGGNRYVKSFPCTSQFLCMAFAQLTHRESLRDIEIGEAARAARPARQHPHVRPCFAWKTGRRERPRPAAARAGRVLPHGPGLSRLLASGRPALGGRILRDPRQVQHEVPPPVFPRRGQVRGRPLRPDRRPDGIDLEERLPAAAAPGQVPRRWHRQDVQFPDQQLRRSCGDHRHLDRSRFVRRLRSDVAQLSKERFRVSAARSVSDDTGHPLAWRRPPRSCSPVSLRWHESRRRRLSRGGWCLRQSTQASLA